MLDVNTGCWTTIFASEELPRLSVQDALANPPPYPSVSYPDRHSPEWMVCTIYRQEAAPAGWLINARTGARFKLPESKTTGLSNHVQVERFSKDGSRFFAFSSSDNEGEPGQNGRHRKLSVYRLTDSGVELIRSFPWDDTYREPEWLGNGQLLYLKRVKSGLLRDRGELWTAVIETGQQRPFFAGSAAVSRPSAE